MKTVVKVVKFSYLTAIFAIAMLSCKKDKVRIDGVDWDDLANVTVKVGETKTVTGKVTPANYNAHLDEFAITSSNTGVATVTGSVSGSKITVSVTGVSPGQSDVAIKHVATGLSKSRTVTVVEADISGIVIATQPTKKTYTTGEQFNPAGLSITVNFVSGAPKTVTAPNADLTYTYDFSMAGENKTVTVTYGKSS